MSVAPAQSQLEEGRLMATVIERASGARTIRAPRGSMRTCSSWTIEAALRMLMNNLDPDVAEDPSRLVVYGGRGQAARNWESFDAIVATLKRLKPDETMLVQSGKPVGVVRTGSRLSQIRFRKGRAQLDEAELAALHNAETLVAASVYIRFVQEDTALTASCILHG